MKPEKRDYLFYLDDMLEAMQRILEYTDGLTFEEFKSSNLKTDAVIRNLEIIGEAANNIPYGVKSMYSKIPWRQMYGLRNLVVHEYFGIDYENIWKIISDDLPQNFQDIKVVVDKEKEK